MKATYHNGRASKGVAYNANHNTKAETRNQQSHIDHERTMENKIWVRDLENLDSAKLRETGGSFDASAYELEFYKQRFGEARERKNADYIRSGHKEDVKTMEQVIRSPKTAPLETIFQIGTSKETTDPAILERATKEFINWMQKEYGSNLDILDVALHVDEATPHIHARCVLYGRDKNGDRDVNQSRAFKELKIDRPDPTKKQGKYNSPLMTFTERNRQKFYDICQGHGLEIDREVKTPSKKYLEVLEYKTEKLQEELAQAKEQLRQYEQQAQEAQREERESQERKQQIDQVAEAAKKEALEFHSQTIEQATQEADSIKAQAQEEAQQITEQAETKKAAAEVTAAAIVEQAENQAEQIIENAAQTAQEALEAAELAELDRDKALQEKADTEAHTALCKLEGERIMREAREEEAKTQERMAAAAQLAEAAQAQYDRIKQQHDDLAAGIKAMEQKGYTQSQIDRLKRDMDRTRAEAKKDGLLWFGDKKVPVTLETLEGLYTKATRVENLDDYAHKLELRERDVKDKEGFVESQFQKIKNEKMEIQAREQALQEPEAIREQRIQREVDRRLETAIPIAKNKADRLDAVEAERDRFRNEVNEYHAIASQLDIGQGVKLQQVIDTVHEAQTQNEIKTQNVAGTVLQVVNQIRNGFEWASQEIRQLADRAKQAWHHHIHRHR